MWKQCGSKNRCRRNEFYSGGTRGKNKDKKRRLKKRELHENVPGKSEREVGCGNLSERHHTCLQGKRRQYKETMGFSVAYRVRGGPETSLRVKCNQS